MNDRINEYEYKPLTKEEERVYLTKIQNGDANAKKEFILKNKGLVYSIARNYCINDDMLDDLYHQGIIGLIFALDKFDITSNNKFSTYATWWIKREIRSYALKNRNPIYFSRHFLEKMEKYSKIKYMLSIRYGRMPNKEEIKDELGWNETTLKTVEFYDRDCFSLNHNILNLNNEQNEEELIDFIAEDYNVCDDAENTLMIDAISDAISNAGLTDNEKELIRLKYYNENHINATNEEIAELFSKKITAEWVRKLEIKALRKIKKHITKNKEDFVVKEKTIKLNKKEKIKLLKDEQFFIYVMEQKYKAVFPDNSLAFTWFKYHFDRDNKRTYVDSDAIEVLQLCKKYKDKYPVLKDKII